MFTYCTKRRQLFCFFEYLNLSRHRKGYLCDYHSNTSILNPLTATRVNNLFLGLPWSYIYTWVEESLYNRLFIGYYKSAAFSITLPKCVVVVLYITFQFSTFYSQEYLPRYPNTDPKVEVRHLVAYHYSPVGGYMVNLVTTTFRPL